MPSNLDIRDADAPGIVAPPVRVRAEHAANIVQLRGALLPGDVIRTTKPRDAIVRHSQACKPSGR